MFPNWPEGSPCHGPGEVEQVYGSVFKCVNGLGDGERVCGALFDVAENGVAGVLKVTSTDEVREAERQVLLSFGEEGPSFSTVDLVKVREHDGTWTFDCKEVTRDPSSGGVSFGFGGVPGDAYCRAAGRLPQPGDRIRVYGRFGEPVRGIDYLVPKGDTSTSLDEWRNVYFKTDAELHQEWAAEVQGIRDRREADFEASQEEMEAAYEALPSIFRRRVDGYRQRGGREWRAGYEKYEVFCLTEAAKITAHLQPKFAEARKLGSEQLAEQATEFWPDADPHDVKRGVNEDPMLVAAQLVVGRWSKLDGDQQEGVISEGHSGNTFGAACHFAILLLMYEAGHEDAPDMIVGSFGALAPLVGSRAYRDQSAEESQPE